MARVEFEEVEAELRSTSEQWQELAQSASSESSKLREDLAKELEKSSGSF